jgi:RNA polymerase sigma-70 factor (sigma-E family)
MRAEHEEAFERFVAARSPDLLRTARLLSHDRGHAEDLVQIALLKAYRHWRRIESADPYAYVRRILVTSAASWWRRRSSSELVALPAREVAVPDATDAVAERDRMTGALSRLPPRMRAVLVLRYAEDLSETATAAALGCSVNTVKTQTARGLARLREQLADERPSPALEEH